MCCNGVLFDGMRLQPSDSVRSLTALGLKLKRRDGVLQFLQPCPAHHDSCCTIYEERPERCRAFSCKQLREATAGIVTETEALEKIGAARSLTDRVRELFLRAGDTRTGKSFSTRYAGIFTPPLDPSPEAVEVREKLKSVMRELEAYLAKEFRTKPSAVDSTSC